MPLLQKGNSKLGDGIWTFSIPAGYSCPGETAACAAACYAKRGHFRYFNVSASHKENWKIAKSARFVNEISKEIEQRSPRVVRIHTAGDFYSAGYVRKWQRIAQAFPDVLFLAYTRSWRIPEIRKSLLQFSQLQNVKLWLSADKDTGRPPQWKSARICYMQSTPDEPVPAWTALVFRVRHKTPAKKINGRVVCPPENGVTNTTCSRCTLCYAPPKKDPLALPVLG